jgi:hypothetical protein
MIHYIRCTRIIRLIEARHTSGFALEVQLRHRVEREAAELVARTLVDLNVSELVDFLSNDYHWLIRRKAAGALFRIATDQWSAAKEQLIQELGTRLVDGHRNYSFKASRVVAVLRRIDQQWQSRDEVKALADRIISVLAHVPPPHSDTLLVLELVAPDWRSRDNVKDQIPTLTKLLKATKRISVPPDWEHGSSTIEESSNDIVRSWAALMLTQITGQNVDWSRF